METFAYVLAAIGGLVIVALIGVGIAYSILLWRVSVNLRETVAEMEEILTKVIAAEDARQPKWNDSEVFIPPMRIFLETTTADIAPFGQIGMLAEQWLLRNAFSFRGQFIIEELSNELLRVYSEANHRILASLRLPSDAIEPYLEFCFDLGDGQLGGVANPPDSTVQLTEEAVGSFHEGRLSEQADLLDRMWREARQLADAHKVFPVLPADIPQFFERAHAYEMDYRIARGGVSEHEIRSSFESQGMDVSAAEIESIQTQWQSAIHNHLLDFSPRALNDAHAGHDIWIVYDGSNRSLVAARLQSLMDPNVANADPPLEERGSLLAELQQLLTNFSPREAVARFRPLLPLSMRYKLIDQLHSPIEADVYRLPSGL